MNFFKNLIAIFALFSIGTLCISKAEQTIFFQEDFSNGIGSWKTVDVDGKTVHSEMRQVLSSIGITLPDNKMSWVVGKVSSNPDDYMALSTSYYDPAGRADDWLISPKITIGENAYLEWSAIAFNTSYPDGYEVYVSTTDDEISSFTAKIFSIQAEPNGSLNRRFVNLSKLGYQNQDIYIAFRNNSNDRFLLGIGDIIVWQPFSYDLSALLIDLKKYIKVSESGISIPFYVGSMGVDSVYSFVANFQPDGEEVVSVTMNLDKSIPYYSYQRFVLPFNWVPTKLGYRTIKLWVSNINGNSENDVNPLNDTTSIEIYVWNNTIASNIFPLFEEFTSSTCGPCASVNKYLNPLLAQFEDKVAIVKYQMNWPGNGDPYYTAEGGVRRTYYGVNGVPSAFANGEPYSFTQENLSAVGMNNLIEQPGFFEIINPEYKVDGRTVTVEADIKPLQSFVGSNIVAHIAVVEMTTYNNKSTNGETEFHYVMKKMLPNANGTVVTQLNKDATQKLYYTYEFTANSTVEEYEDLAVVVWVQDVSSKRVYQSAWAVKKTVLDVPYENDGSGIIAVYPNPANEFAIVKFAVKDEKSISYELYTIDGKLLNSVELGLLHNGYFNERINTSNLSNGQYILKLRIGDRVYTDKIIVNK